MLRKEDRLRLSEVEEISESDSPRLDARRSEHVGDTLKRARERRGEDLADVGEVLRIRLDSLRAIEEGRFDSLPGRAYAIGFIRAYANHLELDAEEMVRRFKQQIGGIDPSAQQLSFPSPPPEGRVPGGAILFVSLVMALAAYGGWYYLASTDQKLSDVVPAVPERLMSEGAGEATDDVEANQAIAAVSRSDEPILPAPVPTNARGGAGGGTGGGEAAVSTGAAGVTTRPAGESDTPALIGTLDPAPEADAPSPAAAPSASQESPEEADAGGPAVEDAGTGEAAPAAPADIAARPADEGDATTEVAAIPEPPPSAPEEGRSGNRLARIELRANAEVWVQVRDSGNTMMTRIMRAGDSYSVPNRDGLVLLTGNAGALEVVVDGEMAPALGNEGEVLRNVALDPDRLKAGRAVAAGG